MDRRIQIVVVAQDQASATINAVANTTQRAMGGMGSGAGRMLTAFMGWQALYGVFNMVGGAIGLVTGAIGSTIEVGVEFNKEMSAISAITGEVGEEYDALRKTAMELGRDTVFTSQEAAEAIKELAKAGIDAQTITSGAAEAALDLASAGELGLAEAAEIMSKALNSFKLEGKDAAMAADVLSNAANASATDVHNIGEAIKFVGPMMQMLSSESYTSAAAFRDTATAVSLLSSSGIDAGMAGAGLQRMLEGLTPNSKKAEQAFRDLGLLVNDKNMFFDAEGNFIGLKAAIDVLNHSMQGLTDEEKIVKIETMFGQRAGRVVQSLMNTVTDNAGAWDEMWTQVGDPGGASETAAIKLNNVAGAIEAMKGSIEFMQVSIWTDAVETKLTGGLAKINTLLDQMGDAFNDNKVATNIELIASMISNAMGKAVDEFGPRILAFIRSIGDPEATAALDELSGAVSDLWNAIFGSGEGVDTSEIPLRGYTDYVKTELPDSGQKHYTFADAVRAVTRAIREVETAVQVYRTVDTAMRNFEAAVNRYADSSRRALENLWPNIQKVWNIALTAISEIIGRNLAQWMVNFIGWKDTLWGTWRAFLSDWAASFGRFFADMGMKWANFWREAGATLGGWIGTAIGQITSFSDSIQRIMRGMWVAVTNIIRSELQAAYNTVITWKNNLISLVTNFSLWSAAKSIGTSIIDGIKAGLSGGEGGLMSTIIGIGGRLIGRLAGAVGARSPATEFIKIGGYITEGLRLGLEGGATSVYLAVDEMGNNMLQIARGGGRGGRGGRSREGGGGPSDFFPIGHEIGEQYTEGVESGVEDGMEQALTTIESVLESIKAVFEQFVSELERIMAEGGRRAGEALRDGLNQGGGGEGNVNTNPIPGVKYPNGPGLFPGDDPYAPGDPVPDYSNLPPFAPGYDYTTPQTGYPEGYVPPPPNPNYTPEELGMAAKQAPTNNFYFQGITMDEAVEKVREVVQGNQTFRDARYGIYGVG